MSLDIVMFTKEEKEGSLYAMTIKKVFISGPMSGLPNDNREAFMEAEKLLRAAGFSVFNPAWMSFDSAWSNGDIAAIDLAALKRCNYIYQLDGWEKSKGASAEWMVAMWCGLKPVNKEWLHWYCAINGEDETINSECAIPKEEIEQLLSEQEVGNG